MTRTKRRRTARKLILPFIALAMMTTMMFMEAHERGQHATGPSLHPARASAARLSHDLRQR